MQSHSHRVGIRTCSDYSPFGVELDGRTVSGWYRYGYNGHEKNYEITGYGNSLSWGDYGMDPRIGRRWNTDPQANRLPGQSTFTVNNDSPISVYDPDGEFGIYGALIGAVASAVADAGYQVYKGMKEGKGFGEALYDINLGEVGAAFVGGAVAGATFGLAAHFVTTMGGAAAISQAGVAYVYGGTAILSTLTGSLVKNAIKGKGKIDGQEVLYDVTYAIPDLLTGGLIDNIGGTLIQTAKKEAQETFKQGKKVLKEEIVKDLKANGAKTRQANKLANKSIKKMEDLINKGSFPKRIKIIIGTEASKITVSGLGSGVLEDYKQQQEKK